MLKRFRIEDSDDDDEGEAGGDEEVDEIGNDDSYMLPEELEEVIKSLSRRVMRSREARKKPRKDLPYH